MNGTNRGGRPGASTRGEGVVKPGAEMGVDKPISKQRDARIISGTRKRRVSAPRFLKLSICYYIVTVKRKYEWINLQRFSQLTLAPRTMKEEIILNRHEF